MKIGTTSSVLAALAIVGAAIAAAPFLTDEPPPFGANQVLARLPGGSSVHSLLRADLDGRPPSEVAVVVRIPRFPGAADVVHTALVFRYDGLRRRYVEAYRASSPGRVPFSVDAVALDGHREAVLFSGLNDDGTRAEEVVALVGGRPAVLRDERLLRRLSHPGAALPGLTWRYVVRNGVVVARTAAVRLRVRQTLRVQTAGGGPASVVLPDARLDVVEAGYRARVPGTYRIRIVTGLAPVEEAFVLSVLVDP